MEEIARRPGGGGGEGSVGATHGAAVSQDRESYALSAGLALGLITLGRGRTHVGLSDLQLEARLRCALALSGCPDRSVGQQSCQCQLSPISNLRLGVRLRLAAVGLQHLWGCMWAVCEKQCCPNNGQQEVPLG